MQLAALHVVCPINFSAVWPRHDDPSMLTHLSARFEHFTILTTLLLPQVPPQHARPLSGKGTAPTKTEAQIKGAGTIHDTQGCGKGAACHTKHCPGVGVEMMQVVQRSAVQAWAGDTTHAGRQPSPPCRLCCSACLSVHACLGQQHCCCQMTISMHACSPQISTCARSSCNAAAVT